MVFGGSLKILKSKLASACFELGEGAVERGRLNESPEGGRAESGGWEVGLGWTLQSPEWPLQVYG